MKNFLVVIVLAISIAAQGQNVNISNGNVFDGEPFLAVNPSNSQHIVIAWMGWVNLANRFQIKIKASLDGGQTWSAQTNIPHTIAGYSSADPCVAFDHLGNVFVSYIDFTGTTPPVTGGVYLSKSIDGGLTWATPTEVITTSFDGSKWPIDRPWMAIDKSAGPNQGNIYITTFNLNRLNPPFNPYLSVSSDQGNTFSSRYADSTNWLAGSLNPLPICFPAVSSDGVLYLSYPSYVLSQSLYTQSFLGVSEDGGNSLSHKLIITNNPPAQLGDYPLAKKGSPLISDPSDPMHLAYILLSAETGDLDVYLTETYDGGDSWSTPQRVNDDPIQNNRMQDLVWADFDNDGDLVISWRDRRNGADSTFQANTEIWAAFRSKDSLTFAPNFQITSQSITHDTDMEEAGNDFMCIQLQDDTLSAAWSDPRDGELNIWFQRMNTAGIVLSASLIASDKVPAVHIYPNPSAAEITIEGEQIQSIELYDLTGKLVISKEAHNARAVDVHIDELPPGSYVVQVHHRYGTQSTTIVKQ